MTTSLDARGRAKSKRGAASATKQAKVEHPGQAFTHPTEVVADPELSTNEKLDALGSLEQDARQLSVASAEGMSGGEDTGLRNVLEAKRTLELPSPDTAFTVVLRTFQDQLPHTLGTETHALITRAMDAITAAREAIARRADMPAQPAGAPTPGSTEELEEELVKEKLDP